MARRIAFPWFQSLFGILFALMLSACNLELASEDADDGISESVITGSVGDGPVVGATLRIFDKDGNLIKEETSDDTASYASHIRAHWRAYPLTIEVIGGTDLVTGREPDFKLVSVSTGRSEKHVNINPFSTLIVQTARAMPGGLNKENVDLARQTVLEQLNFGLDSMHVPDPIGTRIDRNNVAVIVKASEAFGEMIRRSRDKLLVTATVDDADDVVMALAADLADGVLDGVGAPAANPRISALATLTSAQVMLESLSNHLRVDGVEATAAMDASIISTHGNMDASGLTGGVALNAPLLDRLGIAIEAARALAPAIELTTIANAVAAIQPGSSAAQVEPLLPADSSADLDAVIDRAASAPEQDLQVVNETVRRDGEGMDPEPVPEPAANSAPVLNGTPLSMVSEDTRYTFTPLASDADGDTLVFDIANCPSWASFNTASGQITGIPRNADVGTHSGIMISVSDGAAATAIGPFAITVTNANDAPVISGTAPSAVPVGGSYSFRPSASDMDGDTLQFTISNRPAWAAFNAATGRLSGTPGAGDAGSYGNIVISVSDGQATASLAPFAIAVTAVAPVNTPPSISGAPAGTVNENSFYVFTPSAADADGDALSFAISNRPSWASFNTANGRLSGTPDSGDIGTYGGITISVSDGTASTALGPFSIVVNNVNDAPSISGTPMTSVDENVAYSFQPLASDADGDTLTYSISNRPSWASFNTASGRLSGTPGSGDTGVYANIIIAVSDGTETVALGAFTITVNSTAPQTGSAVINWDAPVQRSDGEALSVSEIDGYTIRYGTAPGNYSSSLEIADAAATSATISDLPLGTYYFVVTARDLEGRESGYSNVVTRQVQ